MFRRNETKSRGELLRAELGESWDHALRAAGHAAGGVRAAVGPRVAPAAERVRGAAGSRWASTKSALAPAGEAAQHKVRDVRRVRKPRKPRKPARRWPRVAGLLAGGAAVGVTTAFVLRRRREQREQWEDYQRTEPAAPAGAGSGLDPQPAARPPAAGTASVPRTGDPATQASGATPTAGGSRNTQDPESVNASGRGPGWDPGGPS